VDSRFLQLKAFGALMGLLEFSLRIMAIPMCFCLCLFDIIMSYILWMKKLSVTEFSMESGNAFHV
jgi:hypothetical protein